jgi:uncharacterized protein YndB with AHSA1/START domain
MMAQGNDLTVERVLDAPRDLVWTALTTLEHMKRWWAPRPYQTPEVEIELWPGGRFFTRMTGPDDFEFAGTGCVLEVAEGERLTWTSALLPGFRPADAIEDCVSFPFTAVVTLEDAGDGRTRYRAVAMHRNEADRDTHAKMGFEDGWGTCADQLGEVAAGLAETG